MLAPKKTTNCLPSNPNYRRIWQAANCSDRLKRIHCHQLGKTLGCCWSSILRGSPTLVCMKSLVLHCVSQFRWLNAIGQKMPPSHPLIVYLFRTFVHPYCSGGRSGHGDASSTGMPWDPVASGRSVVRSWPRPSSLRISLPMILTLNLIVLLTYWFPVFYLLHVETQVYWLIILILLLHWFLDANQ